MKLMLVWNCSLWGSNFKNIFFEGAILKMCFYSKQSSECIFWWANFEKSIFWNTFFWLNILEKVFEKLKKKLEKKKWNKIF